MPCSGNEEDHCCYLQGEVCQFLEENTVPGRRWACGLLKSYETWEAVYETTYYKTLVKPKLDNMFNTSVDCGDWPRPGEKCGTCGTIGE